MSIMQPINNYEWDGIPGAKSWSDGSRPLIAYGGFDDGDNWCLIIEPNSANLIVDEWKIKMVLYRCEKTFKNQNAANRWVDRIRKFLIFRADVVKAGFQRC